MTELLPRFSNGHEYDHSPHAEGAYRPAIEEICRIHQLPSDKVSKYDTGTAIVFQVANSHVLKLYPPFWPEQFRIEIASLKHIAGRIGVPTPEVQFTGQIGGWDYLVMSQLRGRFLSRVWGDMPRSEQVRIIGEIGGVVGQLHALPVNGLEPLTIDWDIFVEQQYKSCLERQKREGLSAYWLRQIPTFLDTNIPKLPTAFQPALLHTELDYHVWLLESIRGHWQLTGLFDFADALVGHREAECFITRGDRELLRTYLFNYGYKEDELTAEWQKQKMVYFLLHRYVGLQWQMRQLPPPASIETIEDLASLWFAV